MKITIVTSEPFPVGMAATNRLRTYCKGLAELGHLVTVLCLRPTEKPGKAFNTAATGAIDGVDFLYTCGTTVKPSAFLQRRLTNLRGLQKAAAWLLMHRADAVILVCNDPLVMHVFRFVTWLTHTTYVQEKSEFPISVRRGKNGIIARLNLSVTWKVFDGMICMTNALERFFAPLMRHGAKRLVVPMTVDVTRFESVAANQAEPPYIGYCGFLGGDKDGVPTLIEAFSLIANEFPNLRLKLIGDAGNEQEMKLLKERTTRLGMADRVDFTGRVTRDEMPPLLVGARVLALARPDNKQAAGGFPTKLGEYLSTGNPVVVTAVGEIPDYLHNGENAYVVAPDSAEAFAQGLRIALSDPEKARIIGQAGRDTALRHFHYKPQAERIADFLTSLNGRRS